MNKVTTILSIYKRLPIFPQQVTSIQAQSIPSDIWVDYTVPLEADMQDLSLIIPQAKFNIHYKQNLYHIGRFYYALNVNTEYVFICDDDQLPGSQYFEECINYIESNEDCVIGGYGVVLDPKVPGYNPKLNFGWGSLLSGGDSNVRYVDFVGHSWFMRTKNLKVICNEAPYNITNGEDIFFGYIIQKYLKLPLVVLPHKVEAPKLWSSDVNFAMKNGSDGNATSLGPSHRKIRGETVNVYRKNGWKLILENDNSN